MEEKIKCRTEGLQLMLKESLQKLSKNENLSVVLKEYFLIEQSYSSLINKSQLDKQINKQQLIALLNEYYYKSNDENMILLRRKFEKNIKEIFYSFILTPNFVSLVDKLFGDEGESSFDINKNSIMKGVHASFYNLIVKTIRNSLSLSEIPNFLLYYDKKMINSKINDIIIYKYNFNFNDKEKKSIEFKYLENLYKSFSKDCKPIFDSNIFSLEFRISLFKLIVLTNHKFIKKNEMFNKKFLDKFERYILLLKLKDKDKDKELLDEYNNTIKKKYEELEKELNNIIIEIKKRLIKNN
jgi:hypothetical protein